MTKIKNQKAISEAIDMAYNTTITSHPNISPLIESLFEKYTSLKPSSERFDAERELQNYAKRIARQNDDKAFSHIAALDYHEHWVGEWEVRNEDLRTFATFWMWLGRCLPEESPRSNTLTSDIRKALKVKRLQQALDRYRKSGLTRDHCTLVNKAIWEIDVMRGDWISIFVQGKRPFGNSGVAGSIYEVLEWPMDWPEDESMSEAQEERAWNILDEVIFAIPDMADLAAKAANG